MGKEQGKKSPRPGIGNINPDLMERDKAWDVAIQRMADEWNAEEDNKS